MVLTLVIRNTERRTQKITVKKAAKYYSCQVIINVSVMLAA